MGILPISRLLGCFSCCAAPQGLSALAQRMDALAHAQQDVEAHVGPGGLHALKDALDLMDPHRTGAMERDVRDLHARMARVEAGALQRLEPSGSGQAEESSERLARLEGLLRDGLQVRSPGGGNSSTATAHPRIGSGAHKHGRSCFSLFVCIVTAAWAVTWLSVSSCWCHAGRCARADLGCGCMCLQALDMLQQEACAGADERQQLVQGCVVQGCHGHLTQPGTSHASICWARSQRNVTKDLNHPLIIPSLGSGDTMMALAQRVSTQRVQRLASMRARMHACTHVSLPAARCQRRRRRQRSGWPQGWRCGPRLKRRRCRTAPRATRCCRWRASCRHVGGEPTWPACASTP